MLSMSSKLKNHLKHYNLLMEDMVHCLECDCVYPEHQTQPISKCPYCGNSDMEQTVYLQKEGN